MTSMLELYLDRTAIEGLPSSIKHLTNLTLLNLQDCENLSSFPSVICSLISLEILILSGCKGQPPQARYLSGLIPTLSSIGTTLTLLYTYLTDRQPEAEPISLVLPLSFSGLSSLVSLDLSGCNLLDGALPDDLSYLFSLTSLNLRNNNFTCLPCSISQLLNLKLLFLDHCSKLQSLPYLPLSTQFVSAQGCTSLENYSNQVIVWTSGAARFTFINCNGLADDEGKIADDQILQIKGFFLVLPQIEIPEWFKNKECGPSVRIPLPPNLLNNRSWKGIALCVIFVVPPNLIDVSPGQDSKYFHEFSCHFDMDGSLLNCPLVLKTKRLDIQIKMCGARILYEQDMLEFVQNSRQENFRSCDDLSRGHEKFIEDHMSSSQSYDLKLKQKLNSLLSTLYQVDWAKNHLYDYIFHQIARPPCWFTHVFDESPQDSGRLVVFYIPRWGFQLKQCDHIGASFESSDPTVQFEMCGICLVYEQNVPEFVQFLVECMRLDPDTMRMLLPNNETIQEECTSRETSSNQGGMPRNSPAADRWLRNANIQQKGLIPSPHTPLLMMHKAEKKHEVGKVTDEEQAKQRQLKVILNKLTPQNFDKLFEQVKAVNIDNLDTLTGVISQIFDKALMEPTFCEMCANFPSQLSLELPDFSKDNEKITFKRVFLSKCQEEFERWERELEEANKADEEGEIKQSDEANDSV
uniref:Uncharacterized protein n=1 Tax=Quercus lobata TaxID=97700 RepID=A0A7N2LDE7_QUELO